MLRALLGAAMVLMCACQIHAQAANCDFVMYQNRSFDCDKNSLHKSVPDQAASLHACDRDLQVTERLRRQYAGRERQ